MPSFVQAPSSIAGSGAFAKTNIGAGQDLGTAFKRKSSTGNLDKDFHRTSLGALVNHADKPNLVLKKDGDEFRFVASGVIKKGSELTTDYGAFPWEGKRDFVKKASMLQALLPSFCDELVKLAALSPAQAKERVDVHHQSQDWKVFEKNLNTKAFRQAVVLHPESDAKLKRYTKALGEFKTSKVMGVVPSRTSNKLHKIKELPSGRLGCSCKDWQYEHSHRKTDCAHIQEFKGGMQ